jgi:hypothetical protein
VQPDALGLAAVDDRRNVRTTSIEWCQETVRSVSSTTARCGGNAGSSSL